MTITHSNPYEPTLAAMRAASATAATTFEEGFKIMRQREFARQHAEVDAIPLPRLTASARRI